MCDDQKSPKATNCSASAIFNCSSAWKRFNNLPAYQRPVPTPVPKAITARVEIAELASVRSLIREADQKDVANSALIEMKNPVKEIQNPRDNLPRCGPPSSGI